MDEKQTYTPTQMKQRREAVRRYEEKIDKISILFPAGTKDRISRLTGMSANAFIKEATLAELERIEKYTKQTK